MPTKHFSSINLIVFMYHLHDKPQATNPINKRRELNRTQALFFSIQLLKFSVELNCTFDIFIE